MSIEIIVLKKKATLPCYTQRLNFQFADMYKPVLATSLAQRFLRDKFSQCFRDILFITYGFSNRWILHLLQLREYVSIGKKYDRKRQSCVYCGRIR